MPKSARREAVSVSAHQPACATTCVHMGVGDMRQRRQLGSCFESHGSCIGRARRDPPNHGSGCPNKAEPWSYRLPTDSVDTGRHLSMSEPQIGDTDRHKSNIGPTRAERLRPAHPGRGLPTSVGFVQHPGRRGQRRPIPSRVLPTVRLAKKN